MEFEVSDSEAFNTWLKHHDEELAQNVRRETCEKFVNKLCTCAFVRHNYVTGEMYIKPRGLEAIIETISSS